VTPRERNHKCIRGNYGGGLRALRDGDGGPGRNHGVLTGSSEDAMTHAQDGPGRPGDRVIAHGFRGSTDRRGEILEVLGRPGHEHYRVRWDEEHESILYPDDGVTIERHDLSGRSL